MGEKVYVLWPNGVRGAESLGEGRVQDGRSQHRVRFDGSQNPTFVDVALIFESYVAARDARRRAIAYRDGMNHELPEGGRPAGIVAAAVAMDRENRLRLPASTDPGRAA